MRRTSFKEDTFVDFSGKVRNFVFCAISTDEAPVPENFKALFLGVSVQNPRDEINNPELAKKIAEGKAIKARSRVGMLVSDCIGLINSKVVNALLEQEVEFFKNNPGKYIKGYKSDYQLYQKSNELYYKKYNIKDDLFNI
jgi:hypothetical protein